VRKGKRAWRGIALAAAAAALAGAAGCRSLGRAWRGYAEAESQAVPPRGSAAWNDAEWGAFYALHGDFGALTTDNLGFGAAPWKLLVALAEVAPSPFYGEGATPWRKVDGQPLRRFGFVYNAVLAGPPPAPAAAEGAPVLTSVRGAGTAAAPFGVVRGTAERSACHAGRLWDAEGRPTNEVWWGVPNHALDLDALGDALLRAIDDAHARDDALVAAVKGAFPSVSEDELDGLRTFVLSRAREHLRGARARWGALHPWRYGGPGLFNGPALLHERLAEDPSLLRVEEMPRAYVKVPNLFGTGPGSGDAGLPADGLHPGESPRLAYVRAFLRGARPPPFPAPVGPQAAARGNALYAQRCVRCHGDRAPDGSWSPAPPGGDANAPPLLGAWAQAPYFRNGSVPTLWHVLTPDERPARFWSGGHRLDLVRVGVAGALSADGVWEYPAGHLPWSEPRLYDTREPGRSNAGHEEPSRGLDAAQRWDLIEYLKTL
jgi:hypothetical protein